MCTVETTNKIIQNESEGLETKNIQTADHLVGKGKHCKKTH